MQNPDFLGRLYTPAEMQALADQAHAAGALFVVSVDPISLGLFTPPGQYGADMVTGEGQPMGNALSFGGPYLGIFAMKASDVRKSAGRIVGETVDTEGRRGYVLTLSTREQHIRREKASSNICSNQALCALAAAIYMATMGKYGLKTVAELSYHKAHYAAKLIDALDGYRVIAGRSVLQGVCGPLPEAGGVDQSDPAGRVRHPGRLRPGQGLPAACGPHAAVRDGDEQPRRDRDVGRGAGRDRRDETTRRWPMTEPLIYEICHPGRRAVSLPACDVPESPLPADALRADLPLPEVSEIDVIRHYTRLSQLNHSIDIGFYPLGSCTMKYNPKVNEVAARLPGFASLHPLQDEDAVQGAMGLMYEPAGAAGRDRRVCGGDAAAGGGRARRVHRRADDAQVSVRPRGDPAQRHPGSRLGARHQPSHDGDVGPQGGRGAFGRQRQRRPGGAACVDRPTRPAPGGPDADQSEHSGPVR